MRHVQLTFSRHYSELKAEASRIQMLDHTVRVAPQPLFRDRIDSMYFDKDCENALLFAAWSTFGIRQADLKENVGVYVSDGLVPQCLHEEVSFMSYRTCCFSHGYFLI